MPATVTLSTTTLTYGVDPVASKVTLGSVTGVKPGVCLWIDRELMQVRSVSGLVAEVLRGRAGTAASRHSSSALVTIGNADQFYATDPMGSPASAVLVSPYINTFSGKVFLAQGDSLPEGQTYRWWQEVTTTYGYGPLGVRTQSSSPESGT